MSSAQYLWMVSPMSTERQAESSVDFLGSLWTSDGQLLDEQSLADLLFRCENPLEILPDLRGEFVLCIRDYARNRAYFATGLMASIPLYCYRGHRGTGVLCGSSIKSIVQRAEKSFELNWTLIRYKDRTVGSNLSMPTPVAEIERLSGGCVLTVDLKNWTFQLDRYRSIFPLSVNDHYVDQPLDFFAEEYRVRLSNALKRSLQGSDGSVMVALSGGFDSSILYALASECCEVNAVTICTETSVENKEIHRARELVGHGGGSHLVLPFSFDQEVDLQAWIHLVEQTESFECGFESYLKSQLLHQAAEVFPNQHLLLSGTGSDQFNGGTTALDYAAGGDMNDSWEEFLQNRMRDLWKKHQERNFTDFYRFAYNFASPEQREQVFPFTLKQEWENYLRQNYRFLQRRPLLFESKIFSAYNLRAEFPFLDSDLIEFLLSVPAGNYAELFYDKKILRKAFAELLPASFRDQPKFRRLNNGEEKIYRYMKGLVYSQNYRLLNLVFEASSALRENFDKDRLLTFLKKNELNSYYPAYTHVLRLINVGILEVYLIAGENLSIPGPKAKSVFFSAGEDSSEHSITEFLLE